MIEHGFDYVYLYKWRIKLIVMELILVFGILGMILTGDLFKMNQ